MIAIIAITLAIGIPSIAVWYWANILSPAPLDAEE
jgi:hypothetical protein